MVPAGDREVLVKKEEHMNDTNDTDVVLTRLARALPRDIAPERDLWQG